MDTGKLLLRQLSYAATMARSQRQRAQVAWWQTKIAELHGQQPQASAPRAQPRRKSRTSAAAAAS